MMLAMQRLADLRTFRRFELKFVVPEPIAGRFSAALGPWTVPDSNGGGSYDLESLYYDTNDLRFYWEKVDGLRLRRKLRIRRYVDRRPPTSTTSVYIEIKQRLDRITQKRRFKSTLGDAHAFLDDGVDLASLDPNVNGNNEGNGTNSDHSADANSTNPVVSEIEILRDQAQLRPTLVTGYTRTALVGSADNPGLRITFDRDCYFRSTEPSLYAIGAEGAMLPPGWVIIEIKVNDRLPSWLATLIAGHGLSLTRISKYVQGVERAEQVPRSVFFHDVDRPPVKATPCRSEAQHLSQLAARTRP